ncbi:hypothetical protein RP726_05565 [Candidatus Methylospira mobilis]|uniref:hypothetical protein n=1 Tax=Candidatus Methylospira mobilis TaxID=1808979 RepID=UPI0028F08FB8|nr:hypothetical protein [Candidatus Methylospira mobilis]WNV05879.1 hypothetical protein RP726_05565 [Candidatus Methylospira mobilis]
MSELFGDSFVTGVNNVINFVNDSFGKSAKTQIRLETAINPTTFAADDDSLISVIEVYGALNILDKDDFVTVVEHLSESLNSKMMHAGHAIQFVFSYNPDASHEIDELLHGSRQTSKQLGLDLDVIYDDTKASVARYTAIEHVWIAIWTRPFVLPPARQKQATKHQQERNRKVPYMPGCQNLTRGLSELESEHESLVSSLLFGMKEVDLLANALEIHDVLWFIRRYIDPAFTSRGWRALLPGDRPAFLVPDAGMPALSGFLYPEIGEQLYSRDPYCDGNMVSVGDSWHGTLIMTRPPQTPKPMNALFEQLKEKRVPWSVGFLLEGDGLSKLWFKRALNSVLSATSSANKLFAKGVEELDEAFLNGEAIVHFKATFGSFVHDEPDPQKARQKLKANLSDLSAAIQQWGSCEVNDRVGDSLPSLHATLPALTPKSPAPGAGAPLFDVLKMMPLDRPASAWTSGNVIFRSPSGKLMPHRLGSSQQAAWVDLGVAPMGGGKSVLLNTLNFAFCTQEGLSRLPWLSIIDIGPGSSGLIHLIRESLPPEQKYLAQYHRLRMEPEFAINPFDLPLGMTSPLPKHKSFLVNLLCLFGTDLMDNAPQSGIDGIARACVDYAYDQFSPEGSPRLYTRMTLPRIDILLDNIGFIADQKTSWWEVVDALFDAGYVHEAISAQRYAVPLLPEIAAMARKDAITSIYTHVTPGNEPITTYFWRRCLEALAAYPVFREPTRFDISDAQIISLDLDEVTPKGGPEADRQAGVMYMLAMHVVGSRFFLMPEDVNHAPPRYRPWHQAHVDDIREAPKRLSFDEVHRVVRNASVAKQLVSDLETVTRECRKWNLYMGLYSQSIDDMPDIIIELATSIYILGVGTDNMAANLKKRFGLNDAAVHALKHLGKPGKAGANLLAIFKTAQGQCVHKLTSTVGSRSLWAYSSTTEDVTVRNRLYKQLGVSATLERLAAAFPGGSLKEESERRKRQRGDDQADVLDGLVQELAK